MNPMRYPFGTITISGKTKKLINECLESTRLSGGNLVREFETSFAKIIGTSDAIAVNTGTAADALAMAVMYDFGAQRNDEVIVPALSFAATGNAVLEAGFKPVFVDIERTTLNINPAMIERAITPRTKAIMPVHLMGKCADMDPIMDIASRHKLFVIEDAAEAQGAFYKGRQAGTIGDTAAFSLYIAHLISSVEGGMVTTNKPEYAEILRSLRAHGRACKCEQCVVSSQQQYCAKRFTYNTDVRFVFERIGFSAKMNELEAAVGLGYIEMYRDILSKRWDNWNYIRAQFSPLRGRLQTIDPSPFETMSPYAFPVIVPENASFSRDELTFYLEKNGIDTRSLFASMPTQCKGFGFLGYKAGSFPEAEYIGSHGFHVGIHHDINHSHIDYFIQLLTTFLSEKNA